MLIKYLNIPNLLSSLRLIIAPFLFLIAWLNRPVLFLEILAVSMFSDAVDGFIARRLNQTTTIGAQLDSWGDFLTYCTVAFSVWWLWPDILRRETLFITLAILFYVLPILAGFIKFRQLTSYHTWAAKALGVIICITFYILFLTGINWPFHCAVILQLFVSIEEIAITVLLKEHRHNIPSFWHIMNTTS